MAALRGIGVAHDRPPLSDEVDMAKRRRVFDGRHDDSLAEGGGTPPSSPPSSPPSLDHHGSLGQADRLGVSGRAVTTGTSSAAPLTRFNVLITIKLPPNIVYYLKRLMQHAHSAGIVLNVASWEKDGPMPPERLSIMLQANEYHGLVCGLHDSIDDRVLSLAPNLRVVSTMSSLVDHVDVAACHARGIRVGFTRDVVSETAADMVVALMLAAARRIPQAVDAVCAGAFHGWDPYWMCGTDLCDSTVGFVGVNALAAAAARRLRGFRCRMLYSAAERDRQLEQELDLRHVGFDKLLEDADFVVPVCEVSRDTFNLFRAETFARMRRTAVFVNLVYGPICDHAALYEALKTGVIAAAAVDVADPGPYEPTRLRELANCILLPNLATATTKTRTMMATMTLDNLVAGLLGDDRPEGADGWVPPGSFVPPAPPHSAEGADDSPASEETDSDGAASGSAGRTAGVPGQVPARSAYAPPPTGY